MTHKMVLYYGILNKPTLSGEGLAYNVSIHKCCKSEMNYECKDHLSETGISNRISRLALVCTGSSQANELFSFVAPICSGQPGSLELNGCCH